MGHAAGDGVGCCCSRLLLHRGPYAADVVAPRPCGRRSGRARAACAPMMLMAGRALQVQEPLARALAQPR